MTCAYTFYPIHTVIKIMHLQTFTLNSIDYYRVNIIDCARLNFVTLMQIHVNKQCCLSYPFIIQCPNLSIFLVSWLNTILSVLVSIKFIVNDRNIKHFLIGYYCIACYSHRERTGYITHKRHIRIHTLPYSPLLEYRKIFLRIGN